MSTSYNNAVAVFIADCMCVTLVDKVMAIREMAARANAIFGEYDIQPTPERVEEVKSIITTMVATR